MKKRWVGLSTVAVLIAGVLAISADKDSMVVVSGVKLSPQKVEETVSCVGVVEAVDGTSVLLPTSCRIKRVKVKSGQRVEKGDVLVSIDMERTKSDVTDPAELVMLAALEEQITAPVDGVVVSVRAKAGDVLEMGVPCAVIAQDSDIQVRIGIREKDIKQIKKGMAVRVRGEGFTRDFYNGEVSEISSAARTEANSGTVVEGVIALSDGEADASLRLGLTAKVSVITSVRDNAVIIPYEAVHSDSDGDYVMLAEYGKAVVKQLESTVRVADGLVVDADEWNGKTVIVRAQDVEEGMKISVEEESE